MSVRHPLVIAFEARLKAVFDNIDHHLEAKYGDRYPLHPVRAPLGRTGNPESDGLFNVGAAFSAGYGSRGGRGYVVDVRMATLHAVPKALRATIEDEVATLLREGLRDAFPDRKLVVQRDGPVYKITGDLSLGPA